MPNLRSIKRRIKSAKNVSQITYAMEMVAASKMKKAQVAALSGRPYAEGISEAVSEFAVGTNRSLHPLLQTHDSGSSLIILITTNKGLCGGLNVNLIKHLQTTISRLPTTISYINVGKKGEGFISKTSGQLLADFSSQPLPAVASAITKLVTDGYLSLAAKDIYIAYNLFVNSLRQEPTVKKILPIEEVKTASAANSQVIIEPSREVVFDSLLHAYLENQILDALRQAEASEYSARMVTMKAATDSAHDFISGLTLDYNKARQDQVTNDISDIVTARLSVS